MHCPAQLVGPLLALVAIALLIVVASPALNL